MGMVRSSIPDLPTGPQGEPSRRILPDLRLVWCAATVVVGKARQNRFRGAPRAPSVGCHASAPRHPSPSTPSTPSTPHRSSALAYQGILGTVRLVFCFFVFLFFCLGCLFFFSFVAVVL